MTQKCIWPILLMIVLLSCQRSGIETRSPLEGVWKVAQTRTIWPGGERINPGPQPGLYIFTQHHYSIVWIPAYEPRIGSAKTWFPTDGEKVYDFNTIIVNSGTYELNDSTLTTRPVVAKTPEFMGGWASFRWHVSGNSLWLTGTDIYSRDGVRDPGVDQVRTTIKLVRVE